MKCQHTGTMHASKHCTWYSHAWFCLTDLTKTLIYIDIYCTVMKRRILKFSNVFSNRNSALQMTFQNIRTK